MSSIGEFFKACRIRELSLDSIVLYMVRIQEIRTKTRKPRETVFQEMIKEIEAKHPLLEETKTE